MFCWWIPLLPAASVASMVRDEGVVADATRVIFAGMPSFNALSFI